MQTHRVLDRLAEGYPPATGPVPVEPMDAGIPGHIRIEKIRELMKYVGYSSDGGKVSEDVKGDTVLALIDSARGSFTQRVADIEYLGELGVRFKPIETAWGMLNKGQTYKLLGIGRTTLPFIFADETKKKRWGAQRVDGHTWAIPAGTVNKANRELKTSLSLPDLYPLVRNQGVIKSYDNFAALFTNPPDDMDKADREVLLEKQHDKKFLDDIYGKCKRHTDVTSAAIVVRYLVEQKARLDGWYSAAEAGSILGVSSSQVSSMLKKNQIKGVQVRGGKSGGNPRRLSADHLRDALAERRKAHMGYSTHEVAVDLGLPDRKITQLLRDGKLQANKVKATGAGGRWMFSEEQLQDARHALSKGEADYIQKLKAIRPDGEQLMTVRYAPDILPGYYSWAQDKFNQYRGPENVPEKVWKKMNEVGITYEPLTSEELKRNMIVDSLLERYETIEGISKNVSKSGLRKLGFEIIHQGREWRMRAVKEEE